jgi:pimeloyl-ACP methyl ester carboxylesterase
LKVKVPGRITGLTKVGAACTLLIVAGAGVLRAGDPAPAAVHEIYVLVGDHEVRALCTEGSREVVMLHGDGGRADDWLAVLRRLDGVVGACAYDRSGFQGVHDPPERGWYEFLDELRRTHVALGFERRYVLVGHELGGLYARVYAADRPADVAGMVLIEPAHEDLFRHMRLGMPPEEWREWVERRERPNADRVVEARIAERARTSRVPSIPVTVVTGTIRRSDEGWDPRFLNEAARQVHADILRGVEGGRHVPASRSGSAPHLEQPDLVADEIARVVGASRQSKR